MGVHRWRGIPADDIEAKAAGRDEALDGEDVANVLLVPLAELRERDLLRRLAEHEVDALGHCPSRRFGPG